MLVFYDERFSEYGCLALALKAVTPVQIGHYEIMIIIVIMKAIVPITFSRSVHVILFSNLTLLREDLGVYLRGRRSAHHV